MKRHLDAWVDEAVRIIDPPEHPDPRHQYENKWQRDDACRARVVSSIRAIKADVEVAAPVSKLERKRLFYHAGKRGIAVERKRRVAISRVIWRVRTDRALLFADDLWCYFGSRGLPTLPGKKKDTDLYSHLVRVLLEAATGEIVKAGSIRHALIDHYKCQGWTWFKNPPPPRPWSRFGLWFWSEAPPTWQGEVAVVTPSAELLKEIGSDPGSTDQSDAIVPQDR